jgi:hypothetical protein
MKDEGILDGVSVVGLFVGFIIFALAIIFVGWPMLLHQIDVVNSYWFPH